MSQGSGRHVLGHSHIRETDLSLALSLFQLTPASIIIDKGDGAISPDNPSLSGLFPPSDLCHSSHRRHIGRLRPLLA